MMSSKWLGWYRRRGSEDWTVASEGLTIPEALRRLEDYVRENRIRLVDNRDLCITGGGYPDRVPRRTC